MPAPRPKLVALLESAKDQPDEVAPRLVLADWLEEFGDESDRARAEFVRLHCAWSPLPAHDDPAALELRLRGTALLRPGAYGDAWLGSRERRLSWFHFH